MALNIHKSVVEIQKILMFTKMKDNPNVSYWKYLEGQLDNEDAWDEDLLDEIVIMISDWLGKQSKDDVISVWRDSVTYKEMRRDRDNVSAEFIISNLSDELLDRVMDKLEMGDFYAASTLNSRTERYLDEEAEVDTPDDLEDDDDIDTFDDDELEGF